MSENDDEEASTEMGDEKKLASKTRKNRETFYRDQLLDNFQARKSRKSGAEGSEFFPDRPRVGRYMTNFVSKLLDHQCLNGTDDWVRIGDERINSGMNLIGFIALCEDRTAPLRKARDGGGKSGGEGNGESGGSSSSCDSSSGSRRRGRRDPHPHPPFGCHVSSVQMWEQLRSREKKKRSVRNKKTVKTSKREDRAGGRGGRGDGELAVRNLLLGLAEIGVVLPIGAVKNKMVVNFLCKQ